MVRRKLTNIIVVFLAIAISSSCANNPPPNLSPEARAAWYGLRVVKALDVLRDVAVAANMQQPPLLTTDETRKVVEYHQGAVKTIQETPNGWKSAVLTGLDQLSASLPPERRQMLDPYIALAKTVIREVVQ